MTDGAVTWRSRMAAAPVREVAWFLFFGGAAAGLYVVLCVLMTVVFGIRPSIAMAIALALILPPTYLAQKRVAFRSDTSHRTAFVRYAATQAISNGVAMVGAEVFSDHVRAYPWTAFLFVAGVVACLNYTLLKHWAFRQQA